MGKVKKPKRPAGRPPLGEQKPEPGGRTEDDVLLMRPFEVVLAGDPYTIALLPIRPAAAWRRKVVPIITDYLMLEGIDSADPESFGQGMMAYLADNPDKLMDLFFEYAVDLDRELILDTATEWEVAAAFRQIANAVISPPLLQALNRTVDQTLQ